jgi:pimeloyl-ACP methyl ester carboxylesterase
MSVPGSARARARGKWLVLAVGLGIVLGAYAVRRFAVPRRRFTYLTGTLSPQAYAALAALPQWSAKSLEVAPGISLHGLVRRPLAPAAPWVLFFSGNDATILATGQKLLERVRDGRDWGMAVYAYRGYDSSDGTPDRDALVADADHVFDALLEEEHVKPADVHVVAFSLGGYLAAHVAGEAAKTGRKVASVCLMASVQDITMLRRSWAAKLALGDTYEIDPLLDAVPAPVLVVQGGADETLGAEQGRKIAAHLGDRARYLELPGVGHNPLLESDAAIRAVRAMIEASSRR